MKEFIEKLIGRLEEEKVDIGEKTGFAKGINKSIKIVNQLAEEYNNGWIPVSSGRLPELFGNLEEDEYISSDIVLIADEKHQWMGFYVKTLAEEKWMFSDCGTGQKIDWTEIKYWQPLPYQPKGE